MILNLSIISLNENKPLFEGETSFNAEIHFPLFSINVLSGKKIIVSENGKKTIVYFNEIFIINHFEYVILNKINLVNIVNYLCEKNNKFEYLIQSDLNKYFFNLIRNMPCLKINIFYKNRRYIKKIAFLGVVILYFLTERNLSKDKILSQEQITTQKNIYFVYKKMMTEVNNSAMPLQREGEPSYKEKPVVSSTASLQGGGVSGWAPPRQRASLYDRKKMHPIKIKDKKRGEVEDNEIQYFLHK